MERIIAEDKYQRIVAEALPGWSSIANYEHHRLGRIWFCWSDQVTVTLLNKSSQIISCAVQNPVTGEQFICSAIYASNYIGDRQSLWTETRATQGAYSHLSMPWILIGDYNVTLSSQEHSRAADYLADQTGMRHFQDLVADCGLSDLSATGALFTWWNKQEGDPIGKKLDCALVNGDWLRCFPHSHAHFEAGGISDHARCYVRIAERSSGNRKPFRFFNYLADHNQFLPTVQKVWDQSPPLFYSRTALQMFHKKLKLLKYDLWALNRTQYGDISTKTREAYAVLCDKQNEALLNP